MESDRLMESKMKSENRNARCNVSSDCHRESGHVIDVRCHMFFFSFFSSFCFSFFCSAPLSARFPFNDFAHIKVGQQSVKIDEHQSHLQVLRPRDEPGIYARIFDMLIESEHKDQAWRHDSTCLFNECLLLTASV